MCAAAISAGATSAHGVRFTNTFPRMPTAIPKVDTHGCLIKKPEGKLAVVEGLDEFIVIDTEDVLMICPKENEQNIKKFIDTARFTKGDRFI